MTGFPHRVLGVVATAGLMAGLSSCSHPAPVQQNASFYWEAAKERYAAGDYLKAISHLDHLLDSANPYSSRAVPFSLVLTSGVAQGYMELADYYTAGAKANKGKSLVFQRKASDYRTLANHMVLHFATNTKKLDLIEGDSVQLAFGPPRGNAFEAKVFTTISHGIEITKEDEEGALALALDRGVMLTICGTVGAPNNLAKAAEILQKGEFLVRRAKYTKAVADQLDQVAKLYGPRQLDDSSKMAMLQQMAQATLKDADASHTAMVTQVPGN